MQAELDVIFSPSAIIFDQLSSGTIRTELAAVAGGSQEELNILQADTLLTEVVSSDRFSISVRDCPPGYVLSSVAQGVVTCKCDFDNPNIVDCEGETVLLTFGLWGARGSNEDQLMTHPCPPWYCKCQQDFNVTLRNLSNTCEYAFDSRNPDRQCSCDRKGILCGECKDGRGVSALLNYCVTCEDVSGILVIALVFADVMALVGLLLLKTPLPEFIYPCVFYLQVLPYLTAFFPVTFEKVHPYLYYISSALSFYFVYDFCVYENMDPLVSYFLRYVPFFVSVITGATFAVIRHHSRLLRSPWHGLWWVVLLQYTHVVHTSMSILNCPIIDDQDTGGAPHWFVSGNIQCFHNWHAPVGILAIFTLIFCVSIIVIIVIYALHWMERPRSIGSAITALNDGIGKKYTVWPAVELGRRFLLVLFIVAYPGNDYPAIFILTVIVAVLGYLQPYKHLFTNILEILLCVIVLTMLLLRNTQTLIEDFQEFQRQDHDNDDCEDQFDGVTDLAIYLAVFYYSPLMVFVVVAGLWVFSVIRHCIARKQGPKKAEGSDPTSLEFSDYDHTAAPTFTTTYVSVADSFVIRPHDNAGTEMPASVRHSAQPSDLSKTKVL